jgi:hypothetical protein
MGHRSGRAATEQSAESGALTPARIRQPDPLVIAVTKPAIAVRR